MTEARHGDAASSASPASPASPASGDTDAGGTDSGSGSSSASSQSADSDLPSPALAKAGSENFPVATRLLPLRFRHHLLAVYAFARLVDDVGDEGDVLSSERHRQLDLIEGDLDRIYLGQPPEIPAMCELAVTVEACAIPAPPFHQLIAANRQDQVVTRYADFDELLDYCVLSANPVGHIVLHVFGAATPERLELSDRVCTALQLAEHWQDVGEDFHRGRVYLPADDLVRFGCTEADLAETAAPARLRELVDFETRRAGRMLEEGAPLVRTLNGFARLAVAGYVAGGRAALAAVAAQGHDVLSSTPKPGRMRMAREWLRLSAGGG